MAAPDEPLLPPEAPPRSRRAPLLAGTLLVLASAALGAWLLRRPEAPPPEAGPAAAAPSVLPPASAKPRPGPGAPAAATGASTDEQAARALFDAADAYERAEPGEYEQRIARWREILTRFPTTAAAKQADERQRVAVAALQAVLDREFGSARRDAQTLAAAGNYRDAVESLQAYRSSQTREILKSRADVEIVVIENACRTAYNEAAAQAKLKASKGDYTGASALFDDLSKEGLPEVAARSRSAQGELKVAGASFARQDQVRRSEELRRAIREELAPKVLALVRARQYDEALRELGAAAALPANAAVREELLAERAAVADASSFWEGFLKTLRSKSGTEISLLLADGKRLNGKLFRIAPDRVVLDEGAIEAGFDRLHADLLVGWTIGRSLPSDDPVTYVKAGLFFFLEGRDDLARLYLATARELKGAVDASERVFRAGFLRAATAIKK